MASWRAPLALPLLLGAAAAQCALVPSAAGRVPDADGTVYTSRIWDPDGAGPLQPRVVLGGSFTQLGDSLARGLAVYDPATGDCDALGTGIVGTSIEAIAVLPNNDLVVGGFFSSIDGVAAVNIARWNGTAWQPLGSVPFTVAALTVAANGDLVASGWAAAPTAPRVLRWNGSTWSPMGGGLTGTPSALVTLPSGDIVGGGDQLLNGARLVRWDGVSWSPFALDVNGLVLSLLVLANGDLIATGAFQSAGSVPVHDIARFDGTSWSPLGAGLGGPGLSLAQLPNGDLVAAGVFGTAGGVTVNRVARWNGSAWSTMATGLGIPLPSNPGDEVRTLTALPNGELIAGGSFLSAGGDADRVARWNGTSWGQIRTGTGGAVHGSVELANGDRIVVGEFLTFEGVPARHVARRSGGVWQPLGAGLGGPARAVVSLPNGDVVVGGDFTSAGGVAANRVARWDGSAWHPLGAGLPATVQSLARDANDQILAGGLFPDWFAVWDGQAWHGTGINGQTFPSFAPVRRLLTLPDGEILAVANAVLRWNGLGWTPITPPVAPGPILATGPLAVLGNGDIALASGSQLRLWNGSTWSAVPGGFGPANASVTSLLALPDGGLLAGGSFTSNGATPMPGLARWNGTSWSAVGAGATGPVSDLRWLSDGRVLAVGAFSKLLGVGAGGFAELASTCPASALQAGSGCSGSGGANVLAATSLPWLGSRFTSVGSGMPPAGVVVEVLGLGSLALPLIAVLPQGAAGCVLTTSPDLLQAHLPAAGRVELEFAVPPTAGLIGASFRQQVVPFELDASGAIVSVTATNSLQLTIGAF